MWTFAVVHSNTAFISINFQEFQFVCFSLHTLSHKLIMLIVVFDVANLITKIFIIIDWMVFTYFFFLIFCWRNLWNGLNCFISKIISRKTDKILDSTTNFVNFPKQRTCGLCSRKIEIMNFFQTILITLIFESNFYLSRLWTKKLSKNCFFFTHNFLIENSFFFSNFFQFNFAHLNVT